MFLGYVFIALCESVLDEKEYSLGELSGANAKRAMLVLLIMTMHSFAEGLGVGVSWAGSKGSVQGKFVTTAIGVHNIPEGMTVALLMVPVTKSGARAPHQPAPSTHAAHSALSCGQNPRGRGRDSRSRKTSAEHLTRSSAVLRSLVGCVLGDLLEPPPADPRRAGLPLRRNLPAPPATRHRRRGRCHDFHGATDFHSWQKEGRLTLRCVRLLAGVCGVDSGRAGVDVGVGGGAYRDGLCGEYGGAAAGLREPDVTPPKKNANASRFTLALACQLLLFREVL